MSFKSEVLSMIDGMFYTARDHYTYGSCAFDDSGQLNCEQTGYLMALNDVYNAIEEMGDEKVIGDSTACMCTISGYALLNAVQPEAASGTDNGDKTGNN